MQNFMHYLIFKYQNEACMLSIQGELRVEAETNDAEFTIIGTVKIYKKNG